MADRTIYNHQKLNVIHIDGGLSLADDATSVIDVEDFNFGTIGVKYTTSGGAVYSANFNFYRSNDTITIGDPDNTTDFDNADTDAKFDLYVNSGALTLKNRTGAAVTADVTGIIFK
jgi:hypothetical protein